MTVEAKIVALLSPLVDGRVFSDDAPFETQRPYIIYQQIGGDVITPLSGDIPDKQNGYFQINVWSEKRSEAAALSLQIEAAFRTATVFQAKPMAGPIARRDCELNLRGAQQDFSIWSDR